MKNWLLLTERNQLERKKEEKSRRLKSIKPKRKEELSENKKKDSPRNKERRRSNVYFALKSLLDSNTNKNRLYDNIIFVIVFEIIIFQ